MNKAFIDNILLKHHLSVKAAEKILI